MARSIGLALLAVWGLLLTGAGCAATPTLTPAPPPALPAPAPPVAAPQAISAPSPAEANWQKVVESAKKEGRLTVYSFNFVGEPAIILAKAFRSRYGVEADIISGRGAEFLERLKTEQRIGKMTADVVEGSNIHLRNMKLGGLTVTSAQLPVLQEKDVWWTSPTFQDADTHFLGFTRFYLSPWINTRLVKAGEEPRSWSDLLQPRWRGVMTIGDPNISNLLYYFVLFIEQKRLEPDYLKRLAAQELVMSRGTMDSVEKVARGDVNLAILTSGGEGANMVKEGAPIKAIDMKEGVIANMHSIALIKGAPHPSAAQLFVHWVLSSEGQQVWAEAKAISPLRKGVPDPVPQAARLEPQNPLVLTAEAGERVSDAFRDKIYVPIFKK